MKKLSFLHSLMAALVLTVAFTACSSDDSSDPTSPVDPLENAHYDLTICVGKHGGMSRDKVHYTLSVASLSDPNTEFDLQGQGAEIADYTMENIYDGEFMYQVPNSNDRFSKLQFKDNKVQIVQEQKFQTNTYTARKYTHAWLNGSTLVIMAADGDAEKVLWTKLNTTDMTIIAEGTLDLKPTAGYPKLTTSGLLAYRKSDNKLFYFYYGKGTVSGSGKTTNEPYFHVAVVNPETMAVESDVCNTQAAQMQGSAYGELLQQTIFFDESDNLYLSAFTDGAGQLLRIKRGQTDFEAGYNAFPDAKGKLLTVQYLGNNKVFAYAGDGSAAVIDSYAYYYAIIDVSTSTVTRVQYQGVDLPVSGGSFSQRSCYNAAENLVYFAVNAKDAQPQIYIYNPADGSVKAGARVAEGTYFEQIRYFER